MNARVAHDPVARTAERLGGRRVPGRRRVAGSSASSDVATTHPAVLASARLTWPRQVRRPAAAVAPGTAVRRATTQAAGCGSCPHTRPSRSCSQCPSLAMRRRQPRAARARCPSRVVDSSWSVRCWCRSGEATSSRPGRAHHPRLGTEASRTWRPPPGDCLHNLELVSRLGDGDGGGVAFGEAWLEDRARPGFAPRPSERGTAPLGTRSCRTDLGKGLLARLLKEAGLK